MRATEPAPTPKEAKEQKEQEEASKKKGEMDRETKAKRPAEVNKAETVEKTVSYLAPGELKTQATFTEWLDQLEIGMKDD